MSENEVKIGVANVLTDAQKQDRIFTLIRTAFFGFLALFIIIFSFVWEQGMTDYRGSFVNELKITDNRIDVPGNAYFVSEETGITKVLNVSEVSVGEYLVDMTTGRVWGNFGYSFNNVNINIGEKIVIIPSFSSFDITYEEGVVTLSSYTGNTYVGFVPNGLTDKKYVDEYSTALSNVLLVPSGTRVKILLSRVDDRVTKLLPFKLSKEYSYSFIPSKFYEEEEFVKTNLSQNFEFAESLRKFKRDQFEKDAPQGLSSGLSDFFHENLTVFQSKEEEYYMTKLGSYLFNAVLAGDSATVDSNLNDFKTTVQALPKNVAEGKFFKKFIVTWLSNVIAFGGDDSEYKVLEALLDVSQNLFDKPYSLVVRLSRFNDAIYNDENIEKAYAAYYNGVEKLFKFADNEVKYKKFLVFYNQILDNLLLRFSKLYKEDYFVMKGKLEAEIYSLYYGGQEKEEVKQSFVMRKIDFLKNLKKFFFAEEILLTDARGVMKTLIQELNDYMPAKSSNVAVIDLFAQQLADIGNFWGYINDAEYAKSPLYGDTHKERYGVYLKEKDQVMSILDVQSDILGGDAGGTTTTGNIALEVIGKFKIIGATSVKVDPLENIHQRFVKVSALLGGHVFDAEYDRDYGMVRNVHAYGSLLSDGNVKLEVLEIFLKNSIETVVKTVDVEVDNTVSAETNAQRIAKTIITKKLIEAGFNITVSQVEILDPVNALYRIKDVIIKGVKSGAGSDGANGSGADAGSVGNVVVAVSFDYLANTGEVKNLFVLREQEGINVTGQFPLTELTAIVKDGKY